MTKGKVAQNNQQDNMGIMKWILAAGVTILITLLLMVMSNLSGGMVSGASVQGVDLASRFTPAIIIHLATVIPAIPLGGYVLWAKKGGTTHKYLGRVWGMLMLTTAIASLFIGRPGTGIAGTGFSFIHIFAIVTLISIPRAVFAIRRGDVISHKRAMQGTYVGLLVAGLFSFIPGRILATLAFG